MEAIFISKFLVADKCLFVIGHEAQDIFFVVKIYALLNAAHMLRPQLHCVANKLDLAPENTVVHFGEEETVFLFFDFLCMAR